MPPIPKGNLMKLVYMFRFKQPIGIGVGSYGVFTPRHRVDAMGFEALPGRPVMGVVYEYDYVHQIPLLPEDPDPLPASLQEDGDPDFIREYKLSQARNIADNIKSNENAVRMLKSFEELGRIECIGRVNVDEKGNIVPKKSRTVEPEPVQEVSIEEPVEQLEVTQARRGRPKADKTEDKSE